ncbi:MAG TPA: hypothetical protein VHX39_00160 [Acetobacteraceae bacterium]|nr:hypothetical protein [Acetobacteraceae bacterium]
MSSVANRSGPPLARAAYLIAAAATAMMGFLAVSGKFTGVMVEIANLPPELYVSPFPFEILTAINVLQSVYLAVLLGVFVFLAFRPFWWGKLICLGMGLTWVVGGAGFAMIAGFYPIIECQIWAGVALLLAALMHQIADPRFDAAGRK